jgi:hypothetical protein
MLQKEDNYFPLLTLHYHTRIKGRATWDNSHKMHNIVPETLLIKCLDLILRQHSRPSLNYTFAVLYFTTSRHMTYTPAS